MDEGLARLLHEGEHVLTLLGMDRQRAEEEAEARFVEAQDRAFAFTLRTLELTSDEFQALEPLFREPDDEHHPVVILHAFGCELWIELVGMGDPYDLGDDGVTVRLFPRMSRPDRSVIAQWLVLAERKQQRQALINEAQAKVFEPFAFYRVWFGHGDEEYHDVRHRHTAGVFSNEGYVTVHTTSRIVWVPNPVLVEMITVETPNQLPEWCPWERVEIMGEKVLVRKTPEWAKAR
ncbi:MAG: hypothetical protein BWY63_03212 [Chloroflexi bacterium ADurb.Bin360]|nr:MAG: hypothetical protein BWY63_03212 [Chloroflexi bacterium ADurb.Bin360]